MESSIGNSVYKASDLIFQTSVNVPRGYLIDYQNIDGGDSFKFNLGNNDRIKYLILSVYDQDGNTITDMTDYIIHVQFTINKKSQHTFHSPSPSARKDQAVCAHTTRAPALPLSRGGEGLAYGLRWYSVDHDRA